MSKETAEYTMRALANLPNVGRDYELTISTRLETNGVIILIEGPKHNGTMVISYEEIFQCNAPWSVTRMKLADMLVHLTYHGVIKIHENAFDLVHKLLMSKEDVLSLDSKTG